MSGRNYAYGSHLHSGRENHVDSLMPKENVKNEEGCGPRRRSCGASDWSVGLDERDIPGKNSEEWVSR